MSDCCGEGLLAQMAELKNRALGNLCGITNASPLFKPIVLRTYSYETESYSYEQIEPTPFVDSDPEGPQADVGPGVSNLSGEDSQYQAHLPRQYTEEILKAQTTDFIVDGDITALEAGDRFSGNLCELKSLDDKVTYWEARLLEKRTEQTFTLV